VPDQTPAQTLTAAATLLREAATAATHEGRTTWTLGNTLRNGSPVVVDDTTKPTVLIETWAARLEAVNEYLTRMHPRVGLALADWLESAAEDVTLLGADPHALTLARQLLGDTA
jgi:hypothetical protein